MLTIHALERQFFPKDFTVTDWAALKPYADNLMERPIENERDFKKFWDDLNEFSIVTSDDYAWRYIRMSCDTENKDIESAYDDFVNNISPQLQEYSDKLNRRLAESPYRNTITEKGYAIALRRTEDGIKLFRPENIELNTQESEKTKQYNQTIGAMTVALDGKELTLQEAGVRLEWTDRAKREEAWRAMSERRAHDSDKIDALFGDLITLRQKKARNAGFENYRDYMYASLCRYDFNASDCARFATSIEKSVVPLVADIQRDRKKKMGLDTLRPWDGGVDPQSRPPIKAFNGADDLAEKTTRLFDAVDRDFGDTFRAIKAAGQLDLGSRRGKQAGAYMYPLREKSVPYIFANATQTVGDMTTNIHEGGHAVHETLMSGLRRAYYRDYPSEIAELGSMTMELLTMDNWDVFLGNRDECCRAKIDHLTDIVSFFPWCTTVDTFQNELYVQKDTSPDAVHSLWGRVEKRFSNGIVDWTGLEKYQRTLWHKQGHIIENPFYYVEYGMAQLGAIQIWRNSKQDRKQAIAQYKHALSLGYSRSVPEIYEAAGAKFDFSENMVSSLMNFVRKEIDALQP